MPPAAEVFAQNQRLEKELSAALGEVAALKAQVAWFRQQMFGGGKSETLDRAQVLMKLEGLSVATPVAKVETVTYQRRQPTGEKRPVPAETFAHLPVKEQIVIEPAEVEAEPQAFEQIGEECTFEVDVVPPRSSSAASSSGRSSSAKPTRARLRWWRQHRSVRSRVATPPPACSPGSFCPSTSTTSPCSAKKRWLNAGAFACLANAWSTG